MPPTCPCVTRAALQWPLQLWPPRLKLLERSSTRTNTRATARATARANARATARAMLLVRLDEEGGERQQCRSLLLAAPRRALQRLELGLLVGGTQQLAVLAWGGGDANPAEGADGTAVDFVARQRVQDALPGALQLLERRHRRVRAFIHCSLFTGSAFLPRQLSLYILHILLSLLYCCVCTEMHRVAIYWDWS